MISQRLRGLSQDGEAIDGLIPKLQSLFSSVGINIEDQNGELRSTFDILQDLAGVWDQLSSKQKQYFGEKVAGNRQVKTLNAIMQNWDVVADTIDKANNAQGEALKGNEMYMDSIEGRMTQLQSAFQELAKTTINSDFVKGLTSAGTEVIKLVTNLGGLAPVLTTILGVVIALKGAKIVAGLKAIVAAITSMASGAGLLAGLPGILIAVAGAIAMIAARTNEANSALKKFEEAKESYEKHKTKVESLNDELQTTQDRIDELEAKDSLTIIEQKELDRLKEVNTQLQTQIGLEEKLAEIAQGQARDAATKIIEEENNKKPIVAMTADQIRREISKNLSDDIIQSIVADSFKTSPLFSDEMSYAPTNEEQIRLRIEAIKQDYAELVKVQEQIANLKPGHAAMEDELNAESEAIAASIKNNKEALSDYYNWLAKETEGIDYVEGAKPGSQEARYNEILDFKKIIGEALLYEDAFSLPIDEVFNDILTKYPEAVKELQTKINELGDDWQLGVPDSIKEDMRQTQEELSSEVQKILNIFDQYNDEDIHTSLGDILKKLLDIGNIEDIKRPIIDAEKMYKAGWEEFKDAIGSDDISTYYSTQYSEIVNDIPFTISVTPIKADGSVLSPDELDDYVYEQIDNATSIEDLMENDKLENGGKGLFIHYTPAIDIDPDAAAKIEGEFGLLLHSIDGAFEQAFIENADGKKITVSEYLNTILNAALEDPTYTGQALTEVYTVAKTLADNGYTELLEALNQVDIPEAIRQGVGLDNMDVEDLGVDHLEDIIREMMSRLGFTVEEIEQALREKFSSGIDIDIGPQMNINMEDVIGKLYQTTDGYTKVLSKALSEQEKAGTLTAETLEKVMGESGLEGVSECLEKTAAGYRLNTERVNEYITAQNEDIRLNALAGIMERQYAIEELAAKYGDLETAVLSEADAQQLSNWQNEIIQLQAVADNAIVAADALDELRAATKSSDEDADHTEAQSLLKKTQEAIDVGKLGTDDFREGLDYLLGEGWYERFNGDLDKAIAAFEAKRKKLFADDDADSAINFMKGLDEKGFAEYDKATGKIKMLKNEATGADYTLEEIAKAFGISEDAARDMFELLNSYSFEDKFTFGEDAIEDADKLKIAQDRLNKIIEERKNAEEELAKAEKELKKTTESTDEYEQKKAKIDELNESVNSLKVEEEALEQAVKTTNEAMAEEAATPKTLEEALAKIQEYQAAIDTLEKQGITPTVTITDAYQKLLDSLNDPTTVLTVDTKPGNVDPKIEELEAFAKAINENPNISPEVKATVIGITEAVIENLKKFNGQVKEIDGRKGVLSKVAIQIAGGKAATVMLQAVEDKAEEVEESDPTVNVATEEDKTKNAQTTKDNIDSIFNNPTYADIVAKAKNVDETNKELDDIANKERTAEIKASVVGDLAQAYADSHKLEEGREYEGSGNPFADLITYIVGGTQALEDLTVAANDNTKTIQESSEEKNESSSSKDDSKIDNIIAAGKILLKETDYSVDEIVKGLAETKAEEEALRNALEGGIDLKTSDSEVATIEAGVKIDEETFQKEWDEMFGDELEAPVGINEEEIAEQVKESIEEGAEQANPKDVTVNVNQVLKEGKKAVVKDVNQTVNVKGKDVSATKAVQKVQKKADEGAIIPIDADPSAANSKEDILEKRIETKNYKPIGLDWGNISKEITDLETRLAQKVQKTVEVTYRETNQRPYAKGTTNAKKGLSLVDEKGAELIEHTKQGTYELGTNNGARLTQLDQGDIVHTAEETKKILSRAGGIGEYLGGKISALRAFIGSAFASGTPVSGGGRVNPRKKKDNDDQSSSHGSRGSRSPSGSSSGSGSDAMSEWTKWANQFFDWIEIKLENLKKRTKSFIDEASRAIGSFAKNIQLNAAMDSIRDEIKATEESYEEYMRIANEVLARGNKLNNDIIGKIQNGSIDISQYDEETQQQIREYQQWYEKAQKCLEVIQQLKDQQKELAKQRLQNIIDDYTAWARISGERASSSEAERELREARGEEVSGSPIESYRDTNYEIDLDNNRGKTQKGKRRYRFGYGYGDYTGQIDQMESQRRKLLEERERLQSELKSQMEQGLIQEGDDAWLEIMAQIERLGTEAAQASTAIEKLKDEAREAAMRPIKYELEDTQYDASKINQNMELGTLKGSLGRKGKKENYKELIKNIKEQNANLAIQNDLYRQQQEGLDKNSQKYRELEQKIRENEAAMAANEQEAEQYRQALEHLGIEKLEDQFDGLTNSADKLSDALTINLLKGVEITENTYGELINNANAQIKNLQKQKKLLEKLLQQLVDKYGEDAKTSDRYREIAGWINEIDSQISGLDQSIVQWGRDMDNVEVKKLGWELDDLRNKAEDFNNSISLKKAQGQAIDASDYQYQIDNAKQQNAVLEQQNQEYRKQQEGMDVNSDAYQELEQKINANNDAIKQNLISIEQWTDAMENLPIEKNEHALDRLNDQQERYNDSLKQQELEGKEINTSFYESMIENAEESLLILKKQRANIKALMDELVDTYGESAKESDVYKGLEKQLNDTDNAIRDTTYSIGEWEKAIRNVPVQKLIWQLDELKKSAEDLNFTINFKQASGQALTSEDYENLINNANQQNINMSAQNEEYRSQQESMDVNSEAYQELQQKINANDNAIKQNLISIEQWTDAMENLPIEENAHRLDQLNAKNEEYNDIIAEREALGKEITSKYYENMINNAKAEIAVLKDQRAMYQGLMDALVEMYGESARESDVYKSYESSLNDVNKQIRDLTLSTIEWGQAIKDLEIEKLSWKLDELSEEQGKISSQMSLNEAQGIDVAADAYEKLIKNGNKRIEILEKTNKLLKEQQKGMDKNSKAYQELQSQIVANNEEIADIKVSQEQWNDNIVDIGINNIKQYKDALAKSNEQLDRQKNIQKAMQDLMKADTQRKVRTYVEGQGFVYQRNEDEFRQAQENLESILKDQLMGRLDDLIEALEEAKKDTNIYDKDGNLIGSVYHTPELGKLSDILTRFYESNNNATIDIDTLRDAFGVDSVATTNNNKTSFSIGDIVINEVKDGNELAKTIIDQFPNALLQALFAK